MKALVSAIAVTANPPSLSDNTGDVDRLLRTLAGCFVPSKPLFVPYACMTSVARSFRNADFQGYALVNHLEERGAVVAFFMENPDLIAGMALDLGTTHLEASLINLQDGECVAKANCENAQIRFGADILSRIHHASAVRRQKKEIETRFQDPGLAQLQQSIVTDINSLAEELAKKTKISPQEIRALSVSGNTTMAHLLLGVDPYTLCREPYIPLFNRVRGIEASQLQLSISPVAPLFIMPSIGSYFGGDLISGIVASGMAKSEKTRMLIDVGTNAEVVLGNKEWLIACAGAAGPALEGGVARMGMRAGPGAIEYVAIDRNSYAMEYRTIAGVPPVGLCGSGLIDLVAALYLNQMIDIRGKFKDPEQERDPKRKAFMQQHFHQRNGEWCFVLTAGKTGAAIEEDVVLEQVDLDAMIRSKAAMYAILQTLLGQVGLDFQELDEIIVAGAFGRHINPERAITLGMLPDIALSTYRPIGNSSLKGAEMALMDIAVREECEQIASTITYLELNVNQEFMIRFSGGRFIPHTDPSLFPSVPVFTKASG